MSAKQRARRARGHGRAPARAQTLDGGEELEALLREAVETAGSDAAMRAVVDWLARPLDDAAGNPEPSPAGTRTAMALQDLGGMIVGPQPDSLPEGDDPSKHELRQEAQ